MQVLPLLDVEGKAKMSQICMHVAPKHDLPVPDAGWLCPLSWPFFCPAAFWGLGAGDRVAALGSFAADFSSLLLPESFWPALLDFLSDTFSPYSTSKPTLVTAQFHIISRASAIASYLRLAACRLLHSL